MNSIEARSLAMFVLLCGVLTTSYALYSRDSDRKTCEADAAKAGFKECDDFQRAAAAGIATPAAWAEKIATDEKEARRRAEDKAKEAEAQRLAAEKAAAARAELTRNPATKIKVANFSWKTGGFGSIGIVSITVSNENEFAVKDIVVTCSFSGNSGTHLSTGTQTIYDTVRAKAKRTFPDVNMGFINSQSAKANCFIGLASRS